MRVRMKKDTFWCVFTYRSHWNDRKCWRIRRLSKTVWKVEPFVNALFWKCPVSNVDSWKRRLVKTVPRKASYTVISISVFGWFSMEAWRKRIKKYAFSNKNGSMWTVENEAKTLVWSKIFCFVFVETKTKFSPSKTKFTPSCQFFVQLSWRTCTLFLALRASYIQQRTLPSFLTILPSINSV